MIPALGAARLALLSAIVLALALIFTPVGLRAQAAAGAPAAASTLSGTAVDTAGKPVAGVELTLHRVTGQSGAPVARDTSDAQGRFQLGIPAERDPDAIFFVATRYNGDLFIGQTFKAPYPAGQSYTLTIGVNPIRPEAFQPQPGAAAAAPVPEGARDDDQRAGRLFLAAILALAALGALGFAGARWRRERVERRRRGLVLEVAALDERYADRVTALPPEEAESYRRRRAALAARAAGT